MYIVHDVSKDRRTKKTKHINNISIIDLYRFDLYINLYMLICQTK